MKKTALLVTIFLSAMAAFPVHAAEEPIHLAMTSSYTERHLCTIEVFRPWIEELKKKTNGRLIIDYFNPDTICPNTQVLTALQKGQIALGGNLTTSIPGRLPANTVMNFVCLRYLDAYTSTMAYNELIKKYPQMLEEFDGIKIIALHTSAPQQIHAAKFPINTMEDLKGHKFLSSSADGARLLKALGSNVVMQPNMDMYLSLSRGMGEGCMQPIAPLRSYKLDECTKFHSMIGLYSTPMYVGINQKIYDSLPADLRAIFDETVVSLSARLGETLKKADVVEGQGMVERGHVFNNVPEDELKKMRAIIDPVAREFFLNEMEKRSKIKINAAQLYDDALKIVDEMNAQYADHKAM